MNSIMETVCLICTHVRHRTKQDTSFPKLLVELRREFKRAGLDVKIKSQSKKFLDTEEFYVNAYYDPEDDQNKETPIEIMALTKVITIAKVFIDANLPTKILIRPGWRTKRFRKVPSE